MGMQVQRVTQPKDYAASLIKFRSNEFSQHGEDGIIKHVLSKIGIKNGYACEFGAWDGIKYSNTFALVKKGWKCLMIEADPVKYSDLLETCKANPGIISHEAMVHYIPGKGTKLSDILKYHGANRDFDLLSIDVDSCDYHIWKSLDVEDFHPKIVIIEHSGLYANIIQREGAVHKVDIDGSTAFIPMLELGESKGYTLLCDTGNMIFLRNDLAHFLMSDS
jgi:hypothetical protein